MRFQASRRLLHKAFICDFKHPSLSKSQLKVPKSTIPCPFLERRGYCLKQSRCDFSHHGYYHRRPQTINKNIQSKDFRQQQPAQLHQHQSVPHFLGKQTPYTITNFPPMMSCPTFHPYMNYLGLHPTPVMEIPTRPPRW